MIHVPDPVGSQERAHLELEERAELMLDPQPLDADGTPMDRLFEAGVVEHRGIRSLDLAGRIVGAGRAVRQIHEAHFTQRPPVVTQVRAQIEIEVADCKRVRRKVNAIPGIGLWDQQLRVGQIREAL